MLPISINLNGMTKAELLRSLDARFYCAAFALVLIKCYQSHAWAIGKWSQKLFGLEFTAIINNNDRKFEIKK